MLDRLSGAPLARLRDALDRGSPERAVNLLLGAAVVLSVLLAGSVVAWKRHQQSSMSNLQAEQAVTGPPSFADSDQVNFFTSAACASCAELLIALRAVDWNAHGLRLMIVDMADNGAQLQRGTMNWVYHVPDSQAETLPALFTRDGPLFDGPAITEWLRRPAEPAP